jgi:Cu/Ag efflux protein CusF
MARALAVIAVAILAVSGVALAQTGINKGINPNVMSGEVVSMDPKTGTITVKVDDPQKLDQLKQGDKIRFKKAHNRNNFGGAESTPSASPKPVN